ncbi:MAG: hypothetical protein HN750_05890 [Gemmatimonadales bacterium]|nr:hypothetical protein [Gemmatimonadales bacterium]
MRRLHDLYARDLTRPVLTVFVVALTVRVAVAVASNTLHEGVLIPDEVSYLRIAALMSTGDLDLEPTQRCLEYAIADGTPFYCHYWRGLFASTRTFSWPLTTLFWIFGPHRILGQFLAALAGALAAAVTARLASELVREPFALGAGMVVALLPSQVLLSSVVLRESTIWFLLASLGVLVTLSARQRTRSRLALSAVGLGLLFILLAWLRIQTAVLALWCSVPVFALVGRNRMVRILFAAGVIVLAPVLVGVGPAASGFANDSLARLGYSRNVMSLGAETAFNYSAWSESRSSVAPSESGSSVAPSRAIVDSETLTGALAILEREVEDERLMDAVLIVPSGLYNTMIRPIFWSVSDIRSVSRSHALAGLEAPLWIIGYVLAGVGVYVFRQRVSVIAFPVLFLLAIAFSGAITHGNLGTAFRHRGQVMFALAILAAAGLQVVADSWRPSNVDDSNLYEGDDNLNQASVAY